jgi:hypothetical protein
MGRYISGKKNAYSARLGKADADAQHDVRSFRISIWGWGDDDPAVKLTPGTTARRSASI